MKKILFATTAVAGVAALAAQASAAEAPTLSISGSVEYQYNFYDNDRGGSLGTGAEAVGDASVGQDIRQDNVTSAIIFNASGTADNGLTYGALFDFRMNVTNDESYIYFADSWGRIHFGDDDGATANTTYGGEAALAGTGGFDGNASNYWDTNGVSAVTGPSTLGASDDSSKLVYYTPNFSGFSAAASFSPDGGTTANTNNGGNRNIIEIAAQYDGNFDSVSIGLNAGWRGATPDNDVATEDVSTFEIGGKIGFGGFTIAGAYGDNGESGCGAVTAGCDAGFYYDAGVGYGAGPFKVGAGYFASEATANSGVGDDEVEIWTIGGTYTVAQGLIAFVEYNNGTFTNGVAAGAATDEVENQGFLIGSRVSF